MTQGRGKVSWAGHSSQEEALDAVSLAIAESNHFFLLVTHMLLHTYYALGLFSNCLTEQTFTPPHSSGLTGQADLPPRP